MEETNEPTPTNEPTSIFKPKNNKKARIPLATKIVAKVMTESGFGQREVARELNIALETVQQAIRDTTLDRDLIEKVKSNLPNRLYIVAFKIADRLMTKPDLIEKMNPYMCALVMGIMIDKARLMDGQSTENIAVKGTVAEIQTTLRTIAEMRQRLGQTPPSQNQEDLE
jgi:hypothetical protein